MGKDKDQKLEAPGSAFARMNYLYQASHLVSKLSASNPLSNYYNRVLKEISKKVVEKLHPDLKRTICCACNYPLIAGSEQILVKLKTHKKKKKKMMCGINRKTFLENISEHSKQYSKSAMNKYNKSRMEARNKKPNKLRWSCSKCGFSKNYSQQPSYKLWIHQTDNS